MLNLYSVFQHNDFVSHYGNHVKSKNSISPLTTSCSETTLQPATENEKK